MRLDPIKLQNKINRLEELFSQIISGLKEDRKLNRDATAEYRGLKKEILLSLFKEPIHHTDDSYFPEVRRILQRFNSLWDPPETAMTMPCVKAFLPHWNVNSLIAQRSKTEGKQK